MVLDLAGLPFFFDSTRSMNEGATINLEHWIQIFTTTPEILSTDHSPKQTTDKRIYVASMPNQLKLL